MTDHVGKPTTKEYTGKAVIVWVAASCMALGLAVWLLSKSNSPSVKEEQEK